MTSLRDLCSTAFSLLTKLLQTPSTVKPEPEPLQLETYTLLPVQPQQEERHFNSPVGSPKASLEETWSTETQTPFSLSSLQQTSQSQYDWGLSAEFQSPSRCESPIKSLTRRPSTRSFSSVESDM